VNGQDCFSRFDLYNETTFNDHVHSKGSREVQPFKLERQRDLTLYDQPSSANTVSKAFFVDALQQSRAK
jgi:hypothetical protein